ncbi:succinylglutamate desuccinylase [Ancylomarina euxinus]|uniref:Succinylglutamate desuccinylase n=1 Tax=Ancylomarina euxinus TaxID=2283627 RepID=A0A425Y1X3_9BACT|nr:succinylglutamate desuccinylase/aspartoacylase family protein [Ancylomarina euxinus]MCZ4695034.1 succinylglutamate desuccinylase/aspartoacylase family protein [Ancylomarina euxinus]MUP15030.1 succinylglutamate desuccinylase [Ancylomarina euxinus]RRG21917.1 succinylglutamate desuccinylase [Ancylomarina euxinus]
MSDSKFIILGREIKKGESAILEMDVAKLHTRNNLSIPVIIERAPIDGPVLLLIGGVHGDEINGVAIVRDIIRRKYNKPKMGTVICIPVFNVFGYLNQQREFPDGRDLNRVFPGTATGSLASQFAYKFTQEIAPLVDYVLDFHTGGAGRENYPNVRCDFNNETTLNLAKLFGAKFIIDSNHIAKSIRDLINRMGKTILLFEGGKSLQLDREVINCGVNGALNIMKHLNMQEGELKIDTDYFLLKKTKWLRAPYSGMFESLVTNGSNIKQKTVIGRIYDPYGEFDKNIIAPFDCCIYGLNTAPIVYKGDAIFHVNVETK